MTAEGTPALKQGSCQVWNGGSEDPKYQKRTYRRCLNRMTSPSADIIELNNSPDLNSDVEMTEEASESEELDTLGPL